MEKMAVLGGGLPNVNPNSINITGIAFVLRWPDIIPAPGAHHDRLGPDGKQKVQP